MQVNKAIGMVSLNDALMDLVTKKLVAPDEAYAKAVDKAGFEALAQARRHQCQQRPGTAGAPAGWRACVRVSAVSISNSQLHNSQSIPTSNFQT